MPGVQELPKPFNVIRYNENKLVRYYGRCKKDDMIKKMEILNVGC